MKTEEKILCAAVWYKELSIANKDVPLNRYLPKNCKTGAVFTGLRHGQCIYLKSAITGLRDCECGEHIQGFLTNHNRFVDRQEAWHIASKQHQIIQQSGGYGTLYSEDLY